MASYQEFKNMVLNNAYDIDGYYEMLYFAIGLISIKVDRYDLVSSIFFTSLLCSFDVIIQYIKMKMVE